MLEVLLPHGLNEDQYRLKQGSHEFQERRHVVPIFFQKGF